MAFDFIAGDRPQARDASHRVGSIDYAELPALVRLGSRVDSFFLQRIANLYEDQAFSPVEVDQALGHLLPLMTQALAPGEQVLLHKLIAVLAYAKAMQQPLYGVAD